MKKIFLGFVALFVLTASVFSNTLIGESVGRVVLTTDKLSDLEAYLSKIKKGDVIAVKNLSCSEYDDYYGHIDLYDNYGHSIKHVNFGLRQRWYEGENHTSDYDIYCIRLLKKCNWKKLKVTAYFIKRDGLDSDFNSVVGLVLQAINVPLD